MQNPSDIQHALANEARRGELRQQCASFQGTADALSSLIKNINSMLIDAQSQLAHSKDTLSAFEAGAGPGVTDDYGPKSKVTQMVEAEREAAKTAVVDFVKANPQCSEDDAAVIWNHAALASHPNFPLVLQDAHTFASLYRANLIAVGQIKGDSWEEQRDWIVATPKDTILAM
jgi:hypothetical protein